MTAADLHEAEACMEAAGALLMRADLSSIADAGYRLESAVHILAAAQVPVPPALQQRRLALHRAIGRIGLLIENAGRWCEHRRQSFEPGEGVPPCYDASGREMALPLPAGIALQG